MIYCMDFMILVSPFSWLRSWFCIAFCPLQQLSAAQAREEVAAAQLGALHRKLLQEQEEQDCLRAATMKLASAMAELRDLAVSARWDCASRHACLPL
jgi:hypothetical protein